MTPGVVLQPGPGAVLLSQPPVPVIHFHLHITIHIKGLVPSLSPPSVTMKSPLSPPSRMLGPFLSPQSSYGASFSAHNPLSPQDSVVNDSTEICVLKDTSVENAAVLSSEGHLWSSSADVMQNTPPVLSTSLPQASTYMCLPSQMTQPSIALGISPSTQTTARSKMSDSPHSDPSLNLTSTPMVSCISPQTTQPGATVGLSPLPQTTGSVTVNDRPQLSLSETSLNLTSTPMVSCIPPQTTQPGATVGLSPLPPTTGSVTMNDRPQLSLSETPLTETSLTGFVMGTSLPSHVRQIELSTAATHNNLTPQNELMQSPF